MSPSDHSSRVDPAKTAKTPSLEANGTQVVLWWSEMIPPCRMGRKVGAKGLPRGPSCRRTRTGGDMDEGGEEPFVGFPSGVRGQVENKIDSRAGVWGQVENKIDSPKRVWGQVENKIYFCQNIYFSKGQICLSKVVEKSILKSKNRFKMEISILKWENQF